MEPAPIGTTGYFFRADMMTPQRFSAMPFYQRSEALLLAVEAGFPVAVAAVSVGISEGDARRLMEVRHQHSIEGKEDRTMLAPANLDVRSRRLKVLTALIALADRDGYVSASLMEIEVAAGIGEKTGAKVIRQLIEDGYLRCVRPGARRQTAIYSVTADGRQAAEKAAEKVGCGR